MHFSIGCIHLMFTATRSFQCLCCSTVIPSSNTLLNSRTGISIKRDLWLILSSCVVVIHYFLSPLLITHGFIPLLLSNLLFMVGASYYHYLNFLGYDGKSHKSPFILFTIDLLYNLELTVLFVMDSYSTSIFGANNILPLPHRGRDCPVPYL